MTCSGTCPSDRHDRMYSDFGSKWPSTIPGHLQVLGSILPELWGNKVLAKPMHLLEMLQQNWLQHQNCPVNKHRTERSSERRPLRIPVKSADVLSSLREGGSDSLCCQAAGVLSPQATWLDGTARRVEIHMDSSQWHMDKGRTPCISTRAGSPI